MIAAAADLRARPAVSDSENPTNDTSNRNSPARLASSNSWQDVDRLTVRPATQPTTTYNLADDDELSDEDGEEGDADG